MNGDGDAGNGDYRRRQYNVEEHLSNVRERVAKLEQRDEDYAEIYATKAEVANAKLALVTLWGGMLVTGGVGVASALIRFWPD